MNRKGFTLPLVVSAITLLIIFTVGGFYLGKQSNKPIQNIVEQESNQAITQKLNQTQTFPLKPPSPEEQIAAQKKADEERERMKLKSTQDLPQIAATVVAHQLKNGNTNPSIQFTSNDGEYATVNTGEIGTAGGG